MSPSASTFVRRTAAQYFVEVMKFEFWNGLRKRRPAWPTDELANRYLNNSFFRNRMAMPTSPLPISSRLEGSGVLEKSMV